MLSAINCEYFFLTFTIPKELEEISKNNKKIVLGFLFKASWYSVISYYRKKKIIPGMISQLQTAGRWLMHARKLFYRLINVPRDIYEYYQYIFFKLQQT